MRASTILKYAVPALAMLVSPDVASADAYAFFDGTFTPGTWTTVVVPTGSSQGHSVTQQTSGGDPGYYDQVAISSGGGWTAIWEISPFSFVPATQGAITALSIGYSLQTGPGSAQADYLVILQGGTYYNLAPGDWQTATYSTWTDFSYVTTAADWGDGLGDHPDFSAAGTSIQFGFYASNSYSGSTVGVDNFQVSINGAQVPEPTSLTIAGTGLIGLLLARRRDRASGSGTLNAVS